VISNNSNGSDMMVTGVKGTAFLCQQLADQDSMGSFLMAGINIVS